MRQSGSNRSLYILFSLLLSTISISSSTAAFSHEARAHGGRSAPSKGHSRFSTRVDLPLPAPFNQHGVSRFNALDQSALEAQMLDGSGGVNALPYHGSVKNKVDTHPARPRKSLKKDSVEEREGFDLRDDLMKRVGGLTAAVGERGDNRKIESPRKENIAGRGPLDQNDYSSFVNPFIGTANFGNVFPGATVPFGMSKPGLDTDAPDAQAGYEQGAEFKVLGISQTHDSGVGGSLSLGNFKLFPFDKCDGGFEKCPVALPERGILRKRRDRLSPQGVPTFDVASPGYFATTFENDLLIELTSTRRVALHRYTFLPNSTHPRILIDLTNDGMQDSYGGNLTLFLQGQDHDQVPKGSVARVKGRGDFKSSFGPTGYRAYFCADFKGDGFETEVTEHGVWTKNRVAKGLKTIRQGFNWLDPTQAGALLTLKPNHHHNTTILSRVGISFISEDQACSNAEEELGDWDFEKTRKASRKQWNDILGDVEVDVTGISQNYTELLYTGLYRTHLNPQDYTGENPLWKSDEPYFDSFYCNWDTYRTSFPLYSLTDPVNFGKIVRAMIDIWRHEGWLPECRMSLVQGYTQGGSHGDEILAELLVKYPNHIAALGIDVDDLWKSLVTDAEVEPTIWTTAGRQASVYKEYHFVPIDVFDNVGTGRTTREVSRSLEYYYGDFSLAMVAQTLGKDEDATKYFERASWWDNVWNPHLKAHGFTGMMQPRFPNGTFNYTDPDRCAPFDTSGGACSLESTNWGGFYESSAWSYSQYVPHDTAKLIKLQGGNKEFIKRLDFLFDAPDGSRFDPTNEPSQQIPFQYHYANRPGLSTQRSRRVLQENFSTGPFGIPGNDDSGAMASYSAFFLLGMYPVPATHELLLSSPFFPAVYFHNRLTKKTTTIRSINFSGNPGDGVGGNVFVQKVEIGGKDWHSRCYLNWEDVFMNGKNVELTLGGDMNRTCGEGSRALPPSLSTGGFF